MSDTIEYYDHLVNERGVTLNKSQRQQLEEAGRTIATFGKAGDGYYKLSKNILNGKDPNYISMSERLNNSTNVRSKTIGVVTKGSIVG